MRGRRSIAPRLATPGTDPWEFDREGRRRPYDVVMQLFEDATYLDRSQYGTRVGEERMAAWWSKQGRS